jgi:hypothetical protein
MSETVNSNVDFTYTNLAPLSDPGREALESGLNPNQFVYAEPDPPPPEGEGLVKLSPNQFKFTPDGEPETEVVPVTKAEPRKRHTRKAKKDAHTG